MGYTAVSIFNGTMLQNRQHDTTRDRLSWRARCTLRTQEDCMSRSVSLAAGLLLALATPTSAQSTLPKDLPVNSAITIHGRVAQIQRDGTLSPKTGATATPDTVSEEANNPNPTGVYQLLDARATDAKDTKPTTYALTGHEAVSENSKGNASRWLLSSRRRLETSVRERWPAPRMARSGSSCRR